MIHFKLGAIGLGFCLIGLGLGVGRARDAHRTANADEVSELYAHYDDHFKESLAWATQEMGKEVLQYQTISPGLLPKKVTINGTHRELGYLLGLIAKKATGGAWWKTRTPENDAINQQIIRMYSTISPEYLDFLRGFGQVSNLTLDDMDIRLIYKMVEEFWYSLFQYQKFAELTGFPLGENPPPLNCSVVSYYLENEKRQLIGRNFDSTSDRPHFLVETELEGVYRTIGNACYALYEYVADGINEKGLFAGIATNASPPRYNQRETNYPDCPAIHVLHLMRILLEKCAMVDEAINLIQSARIYFPNEGNHLLLADARGNAAIVEFDLSRKAVVFYRDQAYLVMTNSAFQEGSQFLWYDCWRYRTAVSTLMPGIQEEGKLFETMCAIHPASGSGRSLWTSMFDLSIRQMDVRYRQESYLVPHVFELFRASVTARRDYYVPRDSTRTRRLP